MDRLDTLRRYVNGGHDAVEGWLNGRSAAMIAALSMLQRRRGLRGAVGEIGVHHGRLFILLALTADETETPFAIDLFEQQELNIDESGRGDREAFYANLRAHGIDPEKLHIVTASSLDLSGTALREEIGPARLLSIDGGHTEQCIRNDLAIADALLADHGVVVVDDVFNATWPAVVTGYARYLAADPATVPFATSPNKVYAARAPFVQLYRSFFRRRFPKLYDRSDRFFDHDVDCYGVWLPEPATVRSA